MRAKYFLILLWGLCKTTISAEVIPIKPVENCLLCSSEPSLTMYWAAKSPKAILIYIPGGTGKVGLKEGQVRSNISFINYLSRLSNSKYTSGQFDFVVLDTPESLSPDHMYPSARGSKDHLIRIESAIRFYKEKTHLPVWLLGHSTGGISLSKFIEYAQKNNRADLISGVVASGIRNESYFAPPISFPMLFIHHQQDECLWTQVTESFKNYKNVKSFNTRTTKFVLINGGDQEGDPCVSGFHMYNGSEDLFVHELDIFMSEQR